MHSLTLVRRSQAQLQIQCQQAPSWVPQALHIYHDFAQAAAHAYQVAACAGTLLCFLSAPALCDAKVCRKSSPLLLAAPTRLADSKHLAEHSVW